MLAADSCPPRLYDWPHRTQRTQRTTEFYVFFAFFEANHTGRVTTRVHGQEHPHSNCNRSCRQDREDTNRRTHARIPSWEGYRQPFFAATPSFHLNGAAMAKNGVSPRAAPFVGAPRIAFPDTIHASEGNYFGLARLPIPAALAILSLQNHQHEDHPQHGRRIARSAKWRRNPPPRKSPPRRKSPCAARCVWKTRGT